MLLVLLVHYGGLAALDRYERQCATMRNTTSGYLPQAHTMSPVSSLEILPEPHHRVDNMMQETEICNTMISTQWLWCKWDDDEKAQPVARRYMLEIYWQSERMHIGQEKNNRNQKRKKDSLEKDHWWCCMAVYWQWERVHWTSGEEQSRNGGERTEGLERNNQRILAGILIAVLGGHRKEGRVVEY